MDNVTDEYVAERVQDINYSLIGWYLQTYGMQNTLAFMQWLGVPLFSSADNLKWPEVSPLLAGNCNEIQRKINALLDGYHSLERTINYKFRNKGHLLRAVTHESFVANDLTPHYRGSDFLGDAVLNYAIVRHLFRQPAHLNADDLANACYLLRSNSCLATVSVRNNLHKYLRYTTPTIRGNVNSFAAFLQRNKCKPIDDVRFACNISKSIRRRWFHLFFNFNFQLYFLDRKNFVFEAPEIVSDGFEALIAGIFLDSEMDLNAVTNVCVGIVTLIDNYN